MGFNFLKTVRKGIKSVGKFAKSKVGKVVRGYADKALRGAAGFVPGGAMAYDAASFAAKTGSRMLKKKKRTRRRIR